MMSRYWCGCDGAIAYQLAPPPHFLATCVADLFTKQTLMIMFAAGGLNLGRNGERWVKCRHLYLFLLANCKGTPLVKIVSVYFLLHKEQTERQKH